MWQSPVGLLKLYDIECSEKEKDMPKITGVQMTALAASGVALLNGCSSGKTIGECA